MGLYQRYLLPRLIDLAMRVSEVRRYRALIVPRAHGDVLELGIGSALNLPYYGAHVQRLEGVDPSVELLAMAQHRACDAPFEIELLPSPAESLPLADASFDCVVTTFTLCSVGDPAAAMREARRVLKPGGRLLFAEHGLAPEESVRRWQHRLNPVWRKLAGGCNLDRRIDDIVEQAGFTLGDIQRGYARGPRPFAYIYCGEARAS
ncbi:MAG TPA: class I SAM-dependent methyltransferase [Burkholderiales bacterium]|nr:class I SAM-dependent methyltransferase [Burkholderiales bacterium]